MKKNKANRLAKELSPYLQQHAYNPVDWFPWCEEAFDIAKKQNKPIFLSIGYSTCHWCHVMEHESFEDECVAQLMNDSFINIKVDREERPDIDAVYMNVLQKMTGSGGWPMTILMTPDKKPFFAGTYFPKNDIGHRIGMLNLIPKINEAWNESYFEIIESANDIVEKLNSEIAYKIENSDLEENIFTEIPKLQELATNFYIKNYDKENGGFGKRPKFPTPHNLVFLLNYANKNNNKELLEIVENTLTNIQNGGIHDHIGGGFHRYSTDEKWLLPHFEKMLYDNALLISAFSKLYKITYNEDYLNTAAKTYQYLADNMMSEDNVFYSAEDADSEGEEGKYYIWSKSELIKLLKKNDDFEDYDEDQLKELIEDFLIYLNIKENGNFEDEASRKPSPFNILHITKESSEYIKNKYTENYDNDEYNRDIWEEFLFNALFYLNEKRYKRIKPLKDTKSLLDWNALTVSSLIDLYKIQPIEELNDLIILGYARLIQTFYNDEVIYHTYKDGKNYINAFLDDYAFLIKLSLDIYSLNLSNQYLMNALIFLNEAIDNFYDNDNGGFFQSGKSNEILISKNKELYDGAIPSGNSVMIENIIRAYQLTGNKKYYDILEKSLKYFYTNLKAAPSIYCYLLDALSLLEENRHIVIIENKQDITLDNYLELTEYNIPVLLISEEEIKYFTPLIDNIEDFKLLNNKPTIYYCQNFACEKPVNDLSLILKTLDKDLYR